VGKEVGERGEREKERNDVVRKNRSRRVERNRSRRAEDQTCRLTN
jgi:hypothetical protein